MSDGFSQMIDVDVEDLLEQLTIDEKAALTAGHDFWHTVAIPRLGIPSIRLSDGPNGIRGTRFFDSVPSACLPCGTAIGATFDADLAVKIGHLLGDEAKAKGAHVVLGPTINIQRGPLGGRGFESFSEDPVLSGVLAGNYCKGLKEKDIIATLKHFACNDQEHERMAVNAIVTDRALREIYLLPFMIAIKLAQPDAIMTAYNKVNGTHASEDPKLLQDILRKEWKWNGLLMSDWHVLWKYFRYYHGLTFEYRFGTYSTSEAINAGLDLEMPGPSRWRGPSLVHAVFANKVSVSVLNDRVRAVLELVKLASKSGIPEDASEEQLNRDEDKRLLRQVASESIVLLKNEESILPLNKGKRIAVIGPNAKVATYCGGGSASLNPYSAVTPYEGIAAQVQAGIDFTQGAYGHQNLPQLGKFLHTQDGRQGFALKIYNDHPSAATRHVLEERQLTDSLLFFIDYSHRDLAPIWYADAEGIFTPEESGTYDFGLCVQGTGKLYVDGNLLISNVANQKSGPSFLGSGTLEEVGTKDLVAGRQYRILVQWGCAKTSKLKMPGTIDFGHGGFRFSGCKQICPKTAIEKAEKLAKSVDQVILFAGLSGEWESEGQDRETMDLPPNTDELISRVLEANPNTAIIIQSGTPVTMPWIEKAKAVVHAWYGGNETGNGIADIVFGNVNPSGKLPLTFPRRLQDNPAYLNYRSEGGRVLYGEDVYVGYRYFDKVEAPPLFAFGHGLSYTSFKLSDIQVESQSETEFAVRSKLANTGPRPGAEVVQVYIAPVLPPIRRPAKELKEFKKVYLEPGQETVVHITLDAIRSTSFWDEHSSRWCSHAGTYRIMLGTSSAGEFLEASFEIPRTKFWSGL